ncbi:unnamed protein product [Owenia fusiformis]|uniref:Uncharacterized protein n=1 Tax=Owenia fusiformis TaxID=6347 RepID=A0A8J1TVM7_OWEFU|nr:unnamed protein product [Owenia fusiformis]
MDMYVTWIKYTFCILMIYLSIAESFLIENIWPPGHLGKYGYHKAPPHTIAKEDGRPRLQINSNMIKKAKEDVNKILPGKSSQDEAHPTQSAHESTTTKIKQQIKGTVVKSPNDVITKSPFKKLVNIDINNDTADSPNSQHVKLQYLYYDLDRVNISNDKNLPDDGVNSVATLSKCDLHVFKHCGTDVMATLTSGNICISLKAFTTCVNMQGTSCHRNSVLRARQMMPKIDTFFSEEGTCEGHPSDEYTAKRMSKCGSGVHLCVKRFIKHVKGSGSYCLPILHLRKCTRRHLSHCEESDKQLIKLGVETFYKTYKHFTPGQTC